MNTNLQLNYSVSEMQEVLLAQAGRGALDRIGGFRSHACDGFNVNGDILPEQMVDALKSKLREILFVSRAPSSMQLVALLDESTLLHLYPQKGHVHFEVSNKDFDAHAHLEAVSKVLSQFKANQKREGGVWVDFTHQKGDVINRQTQFLHCPPWKEIEENYSKSVRSKLGGLVEIDDPARFGRLLVWHGPPGTGKTFAIRALMMAWKGRYDFVVVTDPENLAANPSYYYDVASSPCKSAAYNEGSAEESVVSAGSTEPSPRRVLFILEDSADLIITESRSAHYDKVNKLLNITDGLIGQGREDLFLITFNEGLTEIDPAFLRPGRCIAQVEFGKLDVGDSAQWLSNHGITGRAAPQLPGEWSLAELYSKVARKDLKLDLLESESPVVGGFSLR